MVSNENRIALNAFTRAFEPPSWMSKAKCAGYAFIDAEKSDDFFFPTKATHGTGLKQRQTFCSTCPVQEQCEEWGKNEPDGIWGGDYSETRRVYLGNLSNEKKRKKQRNDRSA
jgi:hypothetical protein